MMKENSILFGLILLPYDELLRAVDVRPDCAEPGVLLEGLQRQGRLQLPRQAFLAFYAGLQTFKE